MKPEVHADRFGVLASGQPVQEFTLDNGAGMQLKVLDFGGILRSWTVRDRHGATIDLVLGFDTLQEYERDKAYFGGLVGRFANRIGKGRFTLDNRAWQLPQNDGANHLHGGPAGFSKQMWHVHAGADEDAARVHLYRLSPAGEEGYPGTLVALVMYELSKRGELCFQVMAMSDQSTPVSISQHSYFNLAGGGDVLGHELCIDADYFLPTTPDLIPTGELHAVDGTPFDFRLPRRIGSGLCEEHEQLLRAHGYDHNFALVGGAGPHVCLSDPVSGRRMDIFTDAPGMQFYSGNYLDGSLGGLGRAFERYAGLCLEPQHFPDAPNHPDFPDAICRPGTVSRMTTRYVLYCPGQ